MAERKLSRTDTDFMREYVQEGVDAGETEDQIKSRRKDLTELFGCTLNQVSGAVAWKKEGNEELVLKPLELPTRNFVDDSGDTTIEDNATNHSTGNINEDNELSIPVAITSDSVLEEQSTVISVVDQNGLNSEQNERTHITFHSKGGAWVDFENSHIKEVWRLAEMQFIDRSFPRDPKKRGQLRVLCTPGIKCYKEVERLLSIGIKPENITAIEREKGAWEEFEGNCREKGIQPVFGELSEVLPTITEPFDIVTVDFLGQMCSANERVIAKIPLATRAVLAVNFLAKRESLQTQESLHKRLAVYGIRNEISERVQNQMLDEMHQFPFQGEIDDSFFRRIHKRTESELANADQASIGEMRDQAMWTQMRHAGLGRADNWMFREEILNLHFHPSYPVFTDPEERKVAIQKMIALTCSNTFGPDVMELTAKLVAGGQYRADKRRHRYHLDALTMSSVFGLRQMLDLQKYKYKSNVGKTPSPFYANMALLDASPQRSKQFAASAAFMMKGVLSTLNDGADGLNTDYNFYFDQKHESHMRRGDDVVGVREVLGKPMLAPLNGGLAECETEMARIRVGELVDDLKGFNQMMMDNKYNDVDFIKKIPRKELEL